MEKMYIGQTSNGYKVYLDPLTSFVSTHINDTPNLLGLIKEASEKIIAAGNIIYVQIDLDRIIGVSDIVETDEADNIFYAKQLFRSNYTRFVKNKQQPETSYITVILNRLEDDYIVFDAWVGSVVPPLPSDKRESKESKPFWRTHAVASRNQVIQEGSVIEHWPWD